MQDPDTIKVDQQVEERPFLKIGLEESSTPVDLVELHEPLSWWDINETGLGKKETGIYY